LFPENDASLLKLNLCEGENNPVAGIGRILMPAHIHDVKTRIGKTVLDELASADSDEVPRLLDRRRVFEHFRITFDQANLHRIFGPYE